jgi:NagD protein
VVLGETRTHSFEAITTAIRLVQKGARFIAANPDVMGRSPTARSRPQALSRRSSPRPPG